MVNAWKAANLRLLQKIATVVAHVEYLPAERVERLAEWYLISIEKRLVVTLELGPRSMDSRQWPTCAHLVDFAFKAIPSVVGHPAVTLQNGLSPGLPKLIVDFVLMEGGELRLDTHDTIVMNLD